ncbi:Putative membrane protein insertion efficiency factor [Anatilimnocola aggregata]|uniref:Putative membrane protein insertion efficiency factor n=1 Tax=Anatilimnocola aggregata TaxID=2528021 RepID=A0A517YCN6_9BACT|nr:membrane protein insertion efficiency factor YidD [Anatilimnocola aggregata]QDU28005.1 Putative membrane protein insertion efficiency factor [Anatilimnocola aggregata]
MNSLCQLLSKLLAAVLIGCVRLYQLLLSPIFGRQCRFQPTCSHYYIGAVEKYGPLRGTLKGLWRICRCNPFCRGGYDPP